MPSACRRIAALFAVLALGAFAPVTAALAQGAGDQQYQDPFGGSGSGSSGSGSSGSSGSTGSKTQTTPSGSIQPLSPSPQTSGSGSSGSSPGSGSAGTSGSGTAAATPSTAPQATGSLPNTGLDTRLLLLAGAVLLLVGLGLRLRSAPERF